MTDKERKEKEEELKQLKQDAKNVSSSGWAVAYDARIKELEKELEEISEATSNMNIYDEVEEALEIVGLQSTGNNNEEKVKDMFEYKLLVKAIKRAKKADKLLELLLKLDDCVTVFEVRSFYEKYKNDIQKLREELEEMK